MAKKKSLLDQMRENPRADWKIKDIEKLCSQTGLSLDPPSHGSHFKIYSPHLRDVLTVPARRPIKPPYIRNLVSFADAHYLAQEKGNQTDD